MRRKANRVRRLLSALLVASIWPVMSFAESAQMQLPVSESARWQYFSDQVMGGVSQGRAFLDGTEGDAVLRLVGDVSTENRGGFIQARFELDSPVPADARGVVLVAQGNNERYFIHLRTRGMVLPWQYYQAGFDASAEWQEFRLPFAAFAPSGNLLRRTPQPESIRSLGVVAYGRDHQADVSVKAVGFY